MTEAPRFKRREPHTTTRAVSDPHARYSFYFRNAMGREAKQWTVQPHTTRTERKIIESTNQTTKVAPSGKNSLHVRGVYQAEQQ
jgi:hypothetical protein